jgi:hypothetical protein
MNNVTVSADKKTGAIVVPTKNPEFGYIRLEQRSHSFDENGFMRPVVKSALIKGKVADLKTLGYTKGKVLEGQIVVTESTTPSNPGNLMQDQKIAGDSGVACSIGGAPIYRTARYTMDLEAQDTLLAHDNKDAIKAAQAELATSEEPANLD